jgi:hypothetical protein
MLKWYGFLGLFLIAFGELDIFVLKIEPFYSWNFNFFWFGFILLIDSLVYKLRKNSLIMNRRRDLFIAFISSLVLWWVFEGFNVFVSNWHYINIPEPKIISYSLAFSTVIPAVVETTELLKALRIFDKIKIKLKNVEKLPKFFYILGIISLILPIVYPKYFFPLIWISLFFLIDPYNFRRGSKSIIKMFSKGDSLLLYISFATLITGFFWEFWNFWSYAKWVYTIPFVTGYFPQLFEMPIIGYLGYLPFGLEVFSFYYFFKSFFK